MEGKDKRHIYIIIMLAVSVVICLGMLLFYFKLKSLKGKVETTEQVNIEDTEGALADIYKQMSGLYGISFSITLEGNNKNSFLPEYVSEIVGTASGSAYSFDGVLCGSCLTLSVNTDEEDVFANIYMDDSGVYLVNYKGYPYVKCADGKSGREILNNILDVLSDLPNTEGIKYGKNEDGYNAFSLGNGYTCGNFNFPAGFSAYEVPSSESGFDFYGYGDGIEVKMTVTEYTEFTQKQDTSAAVLLENTKEDAGVSAIEQEGGIKLCLPCL